MNRKEMNSGRKFFSEYVTFVIHRFNEWLNFRNPLFLFFLIAWSSNTHAQKVVKNSLPSSKIKNSTFNPSSNPTKTRKSIQNEGSRNSNTMIQNVNPMLCDPDSGICEIPLDTHDVHSSGVEKSSPVTSSTEKASLETSASEKASLEKISLEKAEKPIRIIYYTDPICSSCWGIEPQLRKLKLEYGDVFEIEYKMGGLLPDWSYNSGGISKPSDVAHHWDEVSEYYQMPIDGDVWLENPLSSSYPPSIAFKAAQIQDEQKAIVFLRILREMVFLQKKNITENQNIVDAAIQAGLDPKKLLEDMPGKGLELFKADLQLAQNLSVRGFPTLILNNLVFQTERVYGYKPYSVFESAIIKLAPLTQKKGYSKDWESLFKRYPSLTLREFSELSEQDSVASEALLHKLVSESKLTELKTKNGSMWIRKP